MADHEVTHGTFTIEHWYPAPPSAVFAAWEDPSVKSRWFSGSMGGDSAPMDMEFRVGGTERASGGPYTEGGPVIHYEGTFLDIESGQRFVVASHMRAGESLISASVVSIEFRPEGDGTKLVQVENDTFFGDFDSPSSRESGVRFQLKALAAELEGAKRT